MNLARKIALAAITGVLGFGLVGLTTPAAHASNDTSWGCGGCRHAPPTNP